MVIKECAEAVDGEILLRIEDTDSTRCRPEFEDAIFEDLAWSGFQWKKPYRRQSDHYEDYEKGLSKLIDLGLLYPCRCSRKEITSNGAKAGWDGLVYPGTCKDRKMTDWAASDSLRLNIKNALHIIDKNLFFIEEGPNFRGRIEIDFRDVVSKIGDPILKRKNTGDPAYHIACTNDDAISGVTHVIRGEDLFHQTWLHVVLQNLMGWETPIYHHHKLITDDRGIRLAKINYSRSIRSYREAGYSREELASIF